MKKLKNKNPAVTGFKAAGLHCGIKDKEIKDLAKNFDDKIEQQINDKAKSITASKLKELYDELMDYVYGDGGIKGY